MSLSWTGPDGKRRRKMDKLNSTQPRNKSNACYPSVPKFFLPVWEKATWPLGFNILSFKRSKLGWGGGRRRGTWPSSNLALKSMLSFLNSDSDGLRPTAFFLKTSVPFAEVHGQRSHPRDSPIISQMMVMMTTTQYTAVPTTRKVILSAQVSGMSQINSQHFITSISPWECREYTAYFLMI